MDRLLTHPDCVIIANGRFPAHRIPLTIIEKANFIICCDGAANEFIARGGKPHAIVGDCDSISPENKRLFSAILHPDLDQDSNDLTKAVNFCIKQEKKDIVIVGGTGLREDHTLRNISLLEKYVKKVNVRMVTNYGIFTPVMATRTFESVKGQQVSIFSIDPVKITTHGLMYPIKNRILRHWWQGTLNESLGASFTIEAPGRIIVFQVFHPDPTEL